MVFLNLTVACYAEQVTYQVIAQIPHQSVTAMRLLQNGPSSLPYYKRYNQYIVFSRDEQTAARILSIARTAYPAIAHHLFIERNVQERLPYCIFVISNNEWMQNGFPADARALYLRGYNEVYVRIHGSERAVTESLIHELTHHVIAAHRLRIPLWYEEGIAQYMSYLIERREVPQRTRYYAPAILKEKIQRNGMHLGKLVSVYGYQFPEKNLFYEYSYQLVRYIDTYGSIDDFSRQYVQQRHDFMTTFRQTVDYSVSSLSDIEQKITAYIARV